MERQKKDLIRKNKKQSTFNMHFKQQMPLTSQAGTAEPSLFDSSIVFTIVRSIGGGMIFFLLRTGGTIT